MLDDLFEMLDNEYRLENISLIAEHLDFILKMTNDFYLKDGRKQDEAIDALVHILLKYKKFEKKEHTAKVHSHCI